MHPMNALVLNPTSTDEKNRLLHTLQTETLQPDEKVEYCRIIEDDGETDTMYVIVYTPRVRSMVTRLWAIGWLIE